MALNEIVATVSLITQLAAGQPVGHATGFFYEQGGRLFLVTNRHVVTNEKKPDTLRLRLHKNHLDIEDNGDLDVPLYSGTTPRWKAHPKHTDADLAVLLLDKATVTKQFFVRAWSDATFLPSNYPLGPGEDVFVMGFPLAFHDVKHNLPLFRSAMIASAYPVPFRGQPLFLTDANLHPGTSGSPVITKPRNIWVDDKGSSNVFSGNRYFILGVHSGTVKPEMTGGTPIGLGAAWYIHLVREIAATFP